MTLSYTFGKTLDSGLLLLLLLILVFCDKVAFSFSGFVCPEPDGKFPFVDDFSCRKFYVCRSSIPVLYECPENHAFHSQWLDCVYEGRNQAYQPINRAQCACGQVEENDKDDPRKSQPWLVAIFQRDRSGGEDWEFISPGAILGPTTILTSCRLGRHINGKFRTNVNASSFHILAGAESLDESSTDEFTQKAEVSLIQINPKNKFYDFCSALMHLKEPLRLNTPYVRPVCLPIFPKSGNTRKDPNNPDGNSGNSFGYSGTAMITNYAEKPNSDGYGHINSKRIRLTSQQFCFAHTFKWSAYCGVPQLGGDKISEICMAHQTVTVAQMPNDKRWYLLGFGSTYTNEVCSIRKLDEDNDKFKWILNGIKCGPFQFNCNNGRCIPLERLCDQRQDCPNNEDEDPKLCRGRNPCINEATFECGVYENCILPKQVCDNFPDCYDASDENPNACRNTKKKNIVPFYISTTTTAPDSSEAARPVPVPVAMAVPVADLPVSDMRIQSQVNNYKAPENIMSDAYSLPLPSSSPSPITNTDSVPLPSLSSLANFRPSSTGVIGRDENKWVHGMDENDLSNYPLSYDLVSTSPKPTPSAFTSTLAQTTIMPTTPAAATTPVKSKKCPPLEANERISLSCASPGISRENTSDCLEEAEVGTVATFRCKTYYKPAISHEDSHVKKCSEDLHWKPTRYYECVPDCGRLVSPTAAYIVNGQSLNSKDRFPWHAALFLRRKNNKFEYICGATLIRQSFVVTAGHCVTDFNGDNNKNSNNFKVVLAPSSSDYEKNLKDPNTQIFDVKKIVVNPHYDPSNNYQSDIAIVALSRESEIGDSVMLACLPSMEIGDPPAGVMGKSVGFGIDESGKVSEELKFANLPIVSIDECIKSVHFIPSINQFCAGYKNGTGVCFGDSGGGFVVLHVHHQRYYLHGIVSVGPRLDLKRRRSLSLTCDYHTYSVFTDVSRFVEWLVEEINMMELEL